MILWLDGSHGAAENMRRDEALLRAAARPGARAVLRLYQFASPSITLGYGQRPERELDVERCAERGVRWAVRPTGGRAILHVEEWTFSLSMAREAGPGSPSSSDAYARTCGWITRALRALGVPADEGRPRSTMGSPARGSGSAAAPCFASLARHEVAIDGRKVAGIAQRRTAGALLQQGSILLGAGHRSLPEYQPLSQEAIAAAREHLASRACEAGEWLGADRRLERFAAALAGVIGPTTFLEGDAGFVLPEGHGPSMVREEVARWEAGPGRPSTSR